MTFADRAPRLWDNGWSAIPCRGKVPLVREWSKWNARLPEADERNMLLGAYGDAPNVGIAVAPWTVAIDVDVKDETIAGEIHNRIVNICGFSSLQRIGRKPKAIYLYRCMPHDVRSEKRHPVEVFSGSGQFIAYGPHPDTGKEYEWIGRIGLASPCEAAVFSAFMPRIEQKHIDRLFAALEDIVDFRRPRSAPRRPAYQGPKGELGQWDAGVLGRAFKYAGQIRSRPAHGGTRIGVICPWTAAHGSGPGAPTSTVVFGPAGGPWGSFHCSHAGCEGIRSFDDVIMIMGRQHGDALSRALVECGVLES